ncbi:MAG: sn-glycerol-3-phosphate ABC transporter ATP-binding protein UgpC [Pseudomonadota bacterium]
MAGITLTDVRKVYAGTVEAVKGVSLDIADGALCVLVGPSGCGKSTLLRMIAGLETITSGEARIGARVVNDLEPSDRDIAMVFQNYALYPHMRVFDNLAYGLRNRGLPKPEIATRVHDAAKLLEIEPYLDRRPRALSGGQRQRVAMGRAIVRDPAVFLFDEPLSNLDAKLRVQMRVEIKALQKRLATTMVYVTHDQLEAMTLADVLVVMNGGMIEQVGPPLELYDRPASTFVAGFLGAPAMNLISPATLSNSKNIPPDCTHIGIRPEALTLGAARDGQAAFEIVIDAVEEVGPECLVHGHFADGTDRLVVRAPAGSSSDFGETMSVNASRDMLHFFDETGQRIQQS